MFIRGFKNNFDRWSLVHFLGPYFLCDFIGWQLTLISVVGWEILDIVWCKTIKYFTIDWQIRINNIWDYRGASWGDLVLGMLAVLIWLLKV